MYGPHRAPTAVAGDLRFVTASFKIITGLERVADLATNLGEYAGRVKREIHPDIDVAYIGERVGEAIPEAMAAYAAEDVDACYAIARRDDEIDDLCERASELVISDLIATEGDDAETDRLFPEVSRLLLAVRDFERVGDHAVNIRAHAVHDRERRRTHLLRRVVPGRVAGPFVGLEPRGEPGSRPVSPPNDKL